MAAPIDLTKYEGRPQLPEGVHVVTVTDRKAERSTNGNDVLKLIVTDAKGNTGEVSLFMNEKSLWKLSNFAKACGLTKDQRQAFTSSMLIGKRLKVRADKQVSDKGNVYTKIEEFAGLEETLEPLAPAAATSRPPAATAPPANTTAARPAAGYDDAVPPGTDDDLPF